MTPINKKPKVHVWIDGSVYPKNPGWGGWGAVLVQGPRERRLSNWMPDDRTTNNQSETRALLGALQALKIPSRVTIFTDSQYVVYGIYRVLRGGLPKTNQIFWEEIAEAVIGHTITVRKIPGHSNIHYNEIAHDLAYEAAKDKVTVDIIIHAPETNKETAPSG
jgi:ribonuclease HI